jgi:histidine triad (HIT) family protein
MDSIFTKIIKGEIPCYKVDENEKFIAFLDINPLAKGHTLVVPKQQVDKIWDINDPLYTEMWHYARIVANKIEKAISCNRVGILVEGLEVPHAHIHLIPLQDNGFNFVKNKLSLSKEEFEDTAQQIRSAI